MSLKKELEKKLAVSIPPIIQKIVNGDSSQKDEFAVLLLPYIKVLLRKYGKAIECMDSTAGWVIMKLLSKIDQIDLSKSVLGYIATTTNNYCIDLYRSTKIRNRNNKNYMKTINLSEEKYDSLENTPEFFIDKSFLSVEGKIIKLYFIDNLKYDKISIETGQTVEFISQVINDTKEIYYNER